MVACIVQTTSTMMSTMHRTPILPLAAAVILTAGLAISGCRGSDTDTTPAAQTAATTPPQPLNQPETVTGCLRAGDAADTFVLTTPQTATGAQPVTYALVSTGNIDLAGHVGERVSIHGTLESQQQATTQSTAQAGKPTGTAGTPTVQTETTLTIRRLDVSSLQPLGDRCDR